jgi:hypothetical protein
MVPAVNAALESALARTEKARCRLGLAEAAIFRASAAAAECPDVTRGERAAIIAAEGAAERPLSDWRKPRQPMALPFEAPARVGVEGPRVRGGSKATCCDLTYQR